MASMLPSSHCSKKLSPVGGMLGMQATVDTQPRSTASRKTCVSAVRVSSLPAAKDIRSSFTSSSPSPRSSGVRALAPRSSSSRMAAASSARTPDMLRRRNSSCSMLRASRQGFLENASVAVRDVAVTAFLPLHLAPLIDTIRSTGVDRRSAQYARLPVSPPSRSWRSGCA